ncbi:MAG: hypothetical protein HONDAALG_00839 [Gammaproteobacteria bacterium]|nr:hypothetical protein [Gammaproteobacteria bacterium]
MKTANMNTLFAALALTSPTPSRWTRKQIGEAFSAYDERRAIKTLLRVS